MTLSTVALLARTVVVEDADALGHHEVDETVMLPQGVAVKENGVTSEMRPMPFGFAQ